MPRKKAVVKTANTLPANLTEQLQEIAQQQGDIVSVRGSQKVSIKPEGFLFPDGEVVPAPMNVIIMGFVNRNIFYSGPYIPGDIKPPTCMAQGYALHEHLKPLDEVLEKQSDTCIHCPQFEFGSDPNGRGGRACKTRTILGILSPASTSEEDTILPLDLSVMGTLNFGTYLRMLKARTGQPVISVITELSIVEAGTSVTADFRSVDNNPNLEHHIGRVEETKTIIEALPQLTASNEQPVKTTKRVTKKKAVRRRARNA